jgi:uncharacterized protein DUF4231
MNTIALVDPRKLAQVIDLLKDQLDLAQVEFLKGRWLHQVQYWDQRSRTARWKYFSLRAVTVIGSVSIPVLTTVTTQAGISPVIASIVASVVAASATWEGVASYGQIWLEKRRAAELLKVEGWLFFQLADKYAGLTYKAAFPPFAAEVERLIAKEVGEYVGVFDLGAEIKRAAQLNELLQTTKTHS